MAGSGFDFRAAQDLLSSHEARIRALEADCGQSAPWSPLLLGSAAPAAAYTGGAIQGTVLRRKNWVFARFQMVISGWSAPGGGFFIRTPWVPRNLVAADQIVGAWNAIQVGGAVYTAGVILSVTATVPGNSADFWLASNTGVANTTATSPWTWANGDILSGLLTFEVLPGY